MTLRTRGLLAALALATAVGVAGCGTPTAGPPADPHTHTGSDAQHTPGMVMPDGSTMGPSSTSTASAQAAADPGPSATALMVCQGEVKDAVKQLSGLTTDPQTSATWKDRLYACTYTLPEGSVVLSVKQSADAASAKAYFDGLQAGAASASTGGAFTALGVPSYQTASGTAAFVRDDMTLLVDATKMPAVVGPQQTERSSYALTLAGNVLVCWKEHSGK